MKEICIIYIVVYNYFNLYNNIYARVVELAYTHVCGDVSTVIKFLNDFEKAEYSLASLKVFKNKNTG